MLTVKKIAAALGYSYDGPEFEIKSVVTDSRKMENHCLFAAIIGERADGHSFIKALDAQYENVVFLGSKKPDFSPRNPYFLVDDVLEGLGYLAKAHLEALPARIIGVTGSVGKTTTKNFILSALSASIAASGTAGNMNNELGVPLTALAVGEQDQAAVIEMGMRGLGQIQYLTRFIRPDIAVITNIGVAHLELLKSRENIARAKLELVAGLKEGGIALLNGDEPLLRNAKAECETYYFGLEAHNDYRAEKICDTAFTLCYPDGELEICLQVEGSHNVMNALAAFAVGHQLGLDPEKIKQGLEQFSGDGRRQFTEQVGGITVIDDSYNAAPDSMLAALKVLASKPPRRFAVLGDMLELGSYEEEGHRSVGRFCASLPLSGVVACGKRAKWIYDELPEKMEKLYTEDPNEALCYLDRMLKAGDAVLFKASNAMNFQALANALKERKGKE